LNLIYFTSHSYEIHFAISIWCLSQYQVSLVSLVHAMFTNKRTVTHPSLIVFFRFISKPNNNYGSNLTFICPCIASTSLKYNQQDATFSRSIFFYKLLYMFQAVPAPIIRSTKLYIQRQVLSNQYCCLLLPWMRWNYVRGWDGTPFHLIHDSSRQQYWFDNTWRCMYSFVLLMMGGGTAWNM